MDPGYLVSVGMTGFQGRGDQVAALNPLNHQRQGGPTHQAALTHRICSNSLDYGAPKLETYGWPRRALLVLGKENRSRANEPKLMSAAQTENHDPQTGLQVCISA